MQEKSLSRNTVPFCHAVRGHVSGANPPDSLADTDPQHLMYPEQMSNQGVLNWETCYCCSDALEDRLSIDIDDHLDDNVSVSAAFCHVVR